MDETREAQQAALRHLTRRDHSVAELRRKLTTRGFPPSCVEIVIAGLTASGYLDDLRFARQWAESSLRNGRGCGPKIREDLRRRGVPDSVIENALADVAAEYDEKSFAQTILARKFSASELTELPLREKRRAAAFLQRRGVSGALIWRLLSCRDDNDQY